MRRIVVGFMSTVSALVLLFSYHTSLGSSSTSAGASGDDTAGTDTSTGTETSTGTDTGTDSGSAATGSDDSSTSSDGTASGDSSGSSSGSSSGASRKYTGDAVNTRWGIVQVEITVKNGKVTKSEAIQYPNGNPRDQEINAFAVPQLNSEAVAAQSGSIDAVSGATVTSDGYIQSLQSAIDQANL